MTDDEAPNKLGQSLDKWRSVAYSFAELTLSNGSYDWTPEQWLSKMLDCHGYMASPNYALPDAAPSGGQPTRKTDSQESPAGEHSEAAAQEEMASRSAIFKDRQSLEIKPNERLNRNSNQEINCVESERGKSRGCATVLTSGAELGPFLRGTGERQKVIEPAATQELRNTTTDPVSDSPTPAPSAAFHSQSLEDYIKAKAQPAPTPRTDAHKAFDEQIRDAGIDHNGPVILDSGLAKTISRELAAANAEIAGLKEKLNAIS